VQSIYFHPINDSTSLALDAQFLRYQPFYSSIYNGTTIPVELQRCESRTLSVFGHAMHLRDVQRGRRNAKLTFADLCEESYGAADFLELAKTFNVLAISHIPKLNIQRRNEVDSSTACL
jgi:predicted ATPase